MAKCLKRMKPNTESGGQGEEEEKEKEKEKRRKKKEKEGKKKKKREKKEKEGVIATTAEMGGLAGVHVGPANGGAARLVGCVGFILLRARKSPCVPPRGSAKGLKRLRKGISRSELPRN